MTPPIELPPVPRGEKRQWVRCKMCGRVAYYDYIPYGLGNPIRTMPCHHSFYHDKQNISEEEAFRQISQEEAQKEADKTYGEGLASWVQH